MKPAILLLLFCTACATREVVRIEYKTLPPQIIERRYLVPVIPIQIEKPEEKKPETA